jgi:Tol biopolymer transport system component/DNA-binding winged helix-turn-helix (wHTH) protein
MDKEKPANSPIFSFDDVVVDVANFRVQKAGEIRKITGRAFEVLVYLLENEGRIVEKQELFERIWRETFVTDNTLTRMVKEVRRVIGDDADEPSYIETIPRRGYRFIAEVKKTTSQKPAAIVDFLQSDKADFPLPETTVETNRPAASTVEFSVKNPSSSSSHPTATGEKQFIAGIKKSHWLFLLSLAALLIVAGLWYFRLSKLSQSSQPMTTAYKIVPFTSLQGNEYTPSFSHDGKYLAYVWANESKQTDGIYVKQLEAGRAIKITTQEGFFINPVWSPDGQFIAYSYLSPQGDDGGVYLVPALGGQERKIHAQAAYDYAFVAPGLSWSPDGKWLAFPYSSSLNESYSIVLVSVDGTQERQLTFPDGVNDDGFPIFSPDGKQLAFFRQNGNTSDIFVVAADGGEPRRLTFDHSTLWSMAWTNDGQAIVFVSGRGGIGRSIWKIATSGGAPEPLPIGDRDIQDIAISPTTAYLAFNQVNEDTNIWRYEFPAGKTATKPPLALIASTRGDSGFDISPDGKRLAIESNRSGNPEIWVCDAENGNCNQLTSFNGPHVGVPRWSPDGKQIAFDCHKSGNADVYVIAEDGSQLRRLTETPSSDSVPNWSRDGKWIYFSSNRNGKSQVWKMAATGGEPVVVTDNLGILAVESKDQRYLYFSAFAVSGIWRKDLQSGEEVKILDFPKVTFWGYWSLTDKGIYYVNTDSTPKPSVEFFDFAARHTKRVMDVEKLPRELAPGFSVAPSGSYFLYTQLDHLNSDITLVENFH